MIINDAAKEQVPDLSITTNSLGKSPIHQRHSDADVAAVPATVGCRVICFARKLRLSVIDGSFPKRRPIVLGASSTPYGMSVRLGCVLMLGPFVLCTS